MTDVTCATMSIMYLVHTENPLLTSMEFHQALVSVSQTVATAHRRISTRTITITNAGCVMQGHKMTIVITPR